MSVRTSAAVVVASTALALCGCGLAGNEIGPVVDGSTPRPVPTAEPTASLGVGMVPYIVFAGTDPDGLHISASGAVAGVLESGGICTFTFSPATGDPVVAEASGVSNVAETSCGVVQLDLAAFAPGEWSVTLRYESSSGSATSDPETMELP